MPIALSFKFRDPAEPIFRPQSFQIDMRDFPVHFDGGRINKAAVCRWMNKLSTICGPEKY